MKKVIVTECPECGKTITVGTECQDVTTYATETPQKGLKRTKIHYQKTADGKILIVGVENVATKTTIACEFGEEVARCYFDGGPSYSMQNPGTADERCMIQACGYCSYIKLGIIYSEEDFGERIAHMKASGDRLQQIKKAVSKYETNTITI